MQQSRHSLLPGSDSQCFKQTVSFLGGIGEDSGMLAMRSMKAIIVSAGSASASTTASSRRPVGIAQCDAYMGSPPFTCGLDRPNFIHEVSATAVFQVTGALYVQLIRAGKSPVEWSAGVVEVRQIFDVGQAAWECAGVGRA